jgi:hypothetical protein
MKAVRGTPEEVAKFRSECPTMQARRARRAMPTTVACAAYDSKSGKARKENGERIGDAFAVGQVQISRKLRAFD